MKVHWLIPGEYSDVNQLSSSSMASIRMRSSLAAQCLLENGNTVSFGDTVKSPVDILVIGKIGAGSQNGRATHWYSIIKNHSLSGAIVVLD